MRFKTLVFKKGTERQEFYGYEPDLGWITCQAPIHMMGEDVTWEDIKKTFPDEHFNGVDLATIEINFVEEPKERIDDGTCCDCGKPRDWVGGRRSQYRCANCLEDYLEK